MHTLRTLVASEGWVFCHLSSKSHTCVFKPTEDAHPLKSNMKLRVLKVEVLIVSISPSVL